MTDELFLQKMIIKNLVELLIFLKKVKRIKLFNYFYEFTNKEEEENIKYSKYPFIYIEDDNRIKIVTDSRGGRIVVKRNITLDRNIDTLIAMIVMIDDLNERIEEINRTEEIVIDKAVTRILNFIFDNLVFSEGMLDLILSKIFYSVMKSNNKKLEIGLRKFGVWGGEIYIDYLIEINGKKYQQIRIDEAVKIVLKKLKKELTEKLLAETTTETEKRNIRTLLRKIRKTEILTEMWSVIWEERGYEKYRLPITTEKTEN